MPALSFLAFVGLALIALLFYGNATLEPISPPAPVTLAPTVTAQTVPQPQSAPDAVAEIGRAARAARAEAPPKNKRVSQTLNYQVTPLLDRFSIKGY
jgi:hypothetical protein